MKRSLAALCLAALVVAVIALSRDEPRDLEVTWGGEDGRSCVYDAARDLVTATLRVEGRPSDGTTVTVTAYADENTSDPVGSGSVVLSEGSRQVQVVVPVSRAPNVDIDGVTACRLSVA